MTGLRLLVIKLADLGDVLTATPALARLRAALPGAHVTALVSASTAAVLPATGLADTVIPVPSGTLGSPRDLARPAAVAGTTRLLGEVRQDWDAVLLLHHLTTWPGVAKYAALLAASGAPVRAGLQNGRGPGLFTHPVPDDGFGARHEVEHQALVADAAIAALGGTVPADPPGPMHYPIPPDAPDRLRRLLGEAASRPFAVLAPGSGRYSLARRWAPARFREVASGLARRGLHPVIAGGPDEADVCAAACPPGGTNLAGQTDLDDLAALLAAAAIVVSNDSGVGQLAAAVGPTRPLVSVFGPSNADAWAPWCGPGPVPTRRILRAGLPCQPCLYTGRSLGTPEGCPPRPCLRLVTSGEVLTAADAALGAAVA